MLNSNLPSILNWAIGVIVQAGKELRLAAYPPPSPSLSGRGTHINDGNDGMANKAPLPAREGQGVGRRDCANAL